MWYKALTLAHNPLSLLPLLCIASLVVTQAKSFTMQFPAWLTWYKKPSYVDVNEFANRIREKAERRSRSMARSSSRPISSRSSSQSSRRTSCDVPSKLSLDRILKNKPCMLNIPYVDRL